jgi:hypothetical protein
VLRGTKRDSSTEICELHHRYGPIFTFWFGSKPFVLIFDLDLARDAFRRNELAGRPTVFTSNNKFYIF